MKSSANLFGLGASVVAAAVLGLTATTLSASDPARNTVTSSASPVAASPVAATPVPPVAAAGPAQPLTVPDDYRLGPRDQVQFQIFEEPDLLTLQRVSASGEIAVPMLNTVKVAGLTLREAELLMEKMYVDQGFYVKVQVTLSLQAYAPRNVSVLGQVNKPDQIDFPVERDSIGIVQAITLAGGFTRVAKADGVRVIRSVNGREQQFTINVSGYLDSKTAEEFKLQSGDVVYVPERVF